LQKTESLFVQESQQLVKERSKQKKDDIGFDKPALADRKRENSLQRTFNGEIGTVRADENHIGDESVKCGDNQQFHRLLQGEPGPLN
jgi:hypothetical protein